MQIERRNQAPEVDAAPAAGMSACHTHAEVTAFTYDDVNSRSRPVLKRDCSLARVLPPT